MDDINDKKLFEKLKAQRKKQLDRQNNYIRQNYDRIAFVIPKGQKAIIEERAKTAGFSSVNDYIKALIAKDLQAQI